MSANTRLRYPQTFCLETDRLVLRCPSPKDGAALHEAILDSLERLQPWFAWAADVVWTLENSETTARYASYRFQSGTEFEFYLFSKGSDQLIGVCGLCHPDWSVPQFELSYWLRPRYEGQGYMVEAATAVIHFAFDTLGSRRLEIHCNPRNKSSLDLARRLGFVTENNLGSELVLVRQSPQQTKI